MQPDRFVEIARPLVRCPTAPFHEHFALAQVCAFARARPRLRLERDEHGNLLLLHRGGGHRRPRLIIQAHLDHPGLLWSETLSPRRFVFELFGGVRAALLRGQTALLYRLERGREQRPERGVIAAVEEGAQRARLLVETARPIEPPGPGTFATWSLPAWRLRGQRLQALACDDLVGAAVGLAFVDEVLRRGTSAPIGLWLTRAEEVGFVGLLAALETSAPDAEATYINIECSSTRAGAALGAGPVIRTGDRLWTFDPLVSGALVAAARDLAGRREGFCFQRKLMDAGACEATALMQAGRRTGAVALPLEHYHNDGGDRLRAECIHLRDALGLVELLVHLATDAGGLDGASQRARGRLDEELAARRRAHQHRLAAFPFRP